VLAIEPAARSAIVAAGAVTCASAMSYTTERATLIAGQLERLAAQRLANFIGLSGAARGDQGKAAQPRVRRGGG